MTRERDLEMGAFDVSENRYRELKYFCRQYHEKKQHLQEITEVSSPGFAMKRGQKLANATAEIAVKRIQMEKEIEMIEQAAMETDAELYPYILKSVTEGTSYDYLDMPMSRSGFYALRKRFFSILHQKR